MNERALNFYEAYDRRGQGTNLKKKHIRQFRLDFVAATQFDPRMSVLELGCGNGLFLHFLNRLGVTDFQGVDSDARILSELSDDIKAHVVISTFEDFFASPGAQRHFDRIVLFDVFEHFTPIDGTQLLRTLGGMLSPQGQIVIRVPNMASPLALGSYYNDVTHCGAYTPGSIEQVARAAGLIVRSVRPQATGTWIRDARRSLFAALMKLLLVQGPWNWAPAFITVIGK